MFRSLLSISWFLLTLSPIALAAEKPKGATAADKGGWRLAVQTYTFNRFTFTESVDKAKELGLKYVEGFAWQKISPETGDAKLNQKAPHEAIEKAKHKLRDAGIQLVNCYISDWGKDPAEMREVFTFAKDMGIETLVGEPSADVLKMLAPFAEEFGINIAIHNHPKHPDKSDYKNWNPDEVMALIKPYGKRIGCCADTGHWVRSGLDPVESLKKYDGRVMDVHFKDVNEVGPKGHDVPFGTGVGKIKEMMRQLKRQQFSGVITIEYEHNMENNMPDLRQSIAYYGKTLALRGK